MRQKQLEIEEFSVYWDTKCTMLGDLPLAEIQVVCWDHYLGIYHAIIILL